ncbi:MAG TPA: gamma-glutamylcyclotransferase family protein [Mucilaginibacter sp.]
MDNRPCYLFVYGTLLDTQNEFGAHLNQNCEFYAEGRFKGVLYEIGEYPGAVRTDGDNYVYGRIFLIKYPENVLKLLDEYEGFGPDELQPNLFVRELAAVETNAGAVECWIYLYNHPVEGLEIISSGKYR